MLLTHTIATTILLFSLATALTVPSPTPHTLDLTHNNSHPLLRPHNLTSFSSSRYWQCFKPSRKLHPTIFLDCQQLAFALDELDPGGRDELLFSPRSVADVQLPFYMRWESCVMDIRGKEEDSWDVFPMTLLVSAVVDMAKQ